MNPHPLKAPGRAPFGRCLAAALAVGLCWLDANCQTVSNSPPSGVAPTAKTSLAAQPRPVAVYDFAFDVANLQTEQGLVKGRSGPVGRLRSSLRSEETPAEKTARFAALLSETIAKELGVLKIPATRQPKGAPWPGTGLVVKGEFVQVDEGNRMKRAVIGFGAGAIETLTQVEIFDLAQSRTTPVLVYGTGTGSKPMPGGIIMMNPYAMAAKYVLSRNATEKDVRALGKKIAHDLAKLEAGGAAKP